MSKPKVVFVVGTRPDAIKTLPVFQAFRNSPEFETVLVSTGQHLEMLQQVFNTFGVSPDVDLGLMKHGQSLTELSGRILLALGNAVEELKPDYIFAQGDTTSTFIASLVAFYNRVHFGHIEAGLRTRDISNPFPEEFNRQATALIATHHFAPTELAAENLRFEHVRNESILVTGNTGIDAVLDIANREDQSWYPEPQIRVVLMTMHRRENWGGPMVSVARAALRLVEAHEDLQLVVAMHRNPIVREALISVLGDHPRIALIEPPEYAQFVKLMQRSTLILSDSGGVQEEAPAFGIPVLVLRDTTERPEGIEAGCARLVGTHETDVYRSAWNLLNDGSAYKSMATAASPYGDGHASQRILNQVVRFFSKTSDNETAE